MFYLFLENIFLVSARTQCIYVLTEYPRFANHRCLEHLKKKKFYDVFVRDCEVRHLCFILSMHTHIHAHFTVPTNEFSITAGVRYNQVQLYIKLLS